MRNGWWLLPLLCASLLFAQDKAIRFEGKTYFKKEQLYEALGLQTPAWYQFYKEKYPKVDTKVIDSLYEVLQNYYKAQGFYHAKFEKEEDNRSVIFHIQSGKAVHITAIKSELEPKYRPLIGQKRGDRFIATKFIDSKQQIKKALLKDGYCNAKLDAKAFVDIVENNASLRYHLQKNGLCHFGKITIQAPKNINKKVIISRLNFRTQSPYSTQKINDAYSALSGLEAFNGVQIRQQKNTEVVNLQIKLHPKSKRISQKIGVGYETNLGPKALFSWEERNFHGDAKKIAFDLKYSQKEQYLKNTLFWPAFTHAPFFTDYYLDLKNEFTFSKYIYRDFKEKKISNLIHLQKNYYQFSIDSGLGFEKIYINKTGNICTISDGHFFLFYPFLNLIYDTRDSKINPKEGIYLSSYMELGAKIWQADTSYSKLLFEGRTIQSFDNLTVALKGRFGVINEIQSHLPESKRFFAGGAFSNRAYGYNRLGATDAKCKGMGGKTIIEGSAEGDYWITHKYGLGLFYDTTMLTEQSFSFDTDFVHTIGAGLRYMTLLGPVKLDVGINLEETSQYAIHFQIGQSF